MGKYQESRYELKYLVTESQASAIRAMTCMHLVNDDHTDDDSIGYRIQSLYMDSPSFFCYQQTDEGIKNRFKLRLRFYDDRPESPIFLEIKRRVTKVIQKKRASLDRKSADTILRGGAPSFSMLRKDSASQRDALWDFCRLRDQINAVGTVYVSYYREAFQCRRGNHYRVTFDRQVSGCLYRPEQGLVSPASNTLSRIKPVVLEMKFVNEPASWMVELARRFDLQPLSVPKYLRCVDAVDARSHSLRRYV